MSMIADSANETTALLHDEAETSDRESIISPPKTHNTIPISVWLVATLGALETVAFYGTLAPLQNYLQNSSNVASRPGAIGLGQSNASRINLLFIAWNYITPILGAALADQYWGRYRTIKNSLLVLFVGSCLLLWSSVVVEDDWSMALGILLAAMVLVGLGAGGVKANSASWVAEQYTKPEGSDTSDNDYEAIVQRIYMFYYMFINVGSLSSILTTGIEHSFGFRYAFAVPCLVIALTVLLLLSCKNLLVRSPPKGSMLVNSVTLVRIIFGRKSEAPRPEWSNCDESDHVIASEAKKLARVWWIFAVFPIYFLAFWQLYTNLVSQAGVMELHGFPNDAMQSLDAITLIIAVPVLDILLFSRLPRDSIALRFGPRIVVGLIMIALAMAYAGGLQFAIYKSPPGYDHPGPGPNQIHVAWQAPVYLLVAFSELSAVTTGMRLAFTQAPESMKSVMMALFQLTIAAGAFLGVIMAPLAQDPRVPWLYISLSLMSFIVAIAFGVYISASKRSDFSSDGNATPAERPP